MNGAEGQAFEPRLILQGIMSHILDVQTTSGSHIGERVFLPRILLCPLEGNHAYDFERFQFPVRPA